MRKVGVNICGDNVDRVSILDDDEEVSVDFRCSFCHILIIGLIPISVSCSGFQGIIFHIVLWSTDKVKMLLNELERALKYVVSYDSPLGVYVALKPPIHSKRSYFH